MTGPLQDKLRRCLVEFCGTDDREQLGEMLRCLPLLVDDRKEQAVRLKAVELLMLMPRQDRHEQACSKGER